MTGRRADEVRHLTLDGDVVEAIELQIDVAEQVRDRVRARGCHSAIIRSARARCTPNNWASVLRFRFPKPPAWLQLPETNEQSGVRIMMKKLMQNAAVAAGFAALLLVGACASTNNAVVTEPTDEVVEVTQTETVVTTPATI